MVSRDSITQALTEIIGPELLTRAAQVDNFVNSVQLTGKPEVKVIALGVSCTREFIEKSLAVGADYLICHHGIGTENVLRGRFDGIENRLKLLIKNDLTVAGFHYSLDAHPVIGNNAQLIKKLSARQTDEPYSGGWGWIAEYPEPVAIEDLISRCERITNHPVYVVRSGPDKIRRLGVCSGGARPHGEEFLEIIDKHIDVHITGEIAEWGPALADEGRFNYLACGHYATEVFGVQALGDKLTQKFGIDVQVKFIDVPSIL